MKIAAPDVERLIERQHAFEMLVYSKQAEAEARRIIGNYSGLQLTEKIAALVHAADALSAAHTREAEREAIFEAVVDALEGRNVSDFMESFPAVRLALDARAREADLWAKYENVCRLYQVTSEREAALRAENERLKAHVAHLEAENAIAKAAYQEMHDAACEESTKAEAAEAALKGQQVVHREGET